MAAARTRSRKQDTHARILAAAAKSIRERGVEGAGVDRVMAEAGLTRGGFYAHFADRHAMVAEALDFAFEVTKKNLFDLPETGDAWLARATRRYLGGAHRDAVGEGCPLPVLVGEMTRAPGEVRATFERQVEDVLDRIARRLGEGATTTPDDRRRAAGVLAAWVGALAIARSVSAPVGEEILAAVRDALAPRAASGGRGGPARPVDQPGAANGLASNGARANSSEALPESTRSSASSGRPARARARTSRSQA
jgi:TetR/AcrR family transcriptional repressor of nem operon